ncbi:hypothetical protein LY78DRAFT_354081 [Colletotrichum sublineola]|nr:hypothetical protein LY78DRAFT_354081 [Colletotrichum sublineola]
MRLLSGVAAVERGWSSMTGAIVRSGFVGIPSTIALEVYSTYPRLYSDEPRGYGKAGNRKSVEAWLPRENGMSSETTKNTSDSTVDLWNGLVRGAGR